MEDDVKCAEYSSRPKLASEGIISQHRYVNIRDYEGVFPPLCTLCLYVVYVMCMCRPYSWEGAFVLFPCDMRVIDYRCGSVANGI